MLDVFINDNSEKNNIKYTKFILLILICIIFLLINLLIRNLKSPINPGGNNILVECMIVNNFMRLFNLILCIISIGACVFYYNSTKKKEIFIVSLAFMVLSVEIFFRCYDVIFCINDLNKIEGGYKVINSILRVTLLFIAISKFEKLKKYITSNKWFITGCIYIISIIANIMEEKNGILYFFKQDNFAILYSIVFILIYSIIGITFMRKAFKDREYIYAIIGSSIILFAIKAIYAIFIIVDPNFVLKVISIGITYTTFINIISGLFIEIMIKVSKSTILEEKMLVFYSLIENDPHSEIMICTEDEEVVYCNKMVRKIYEEIHKKEMTYEKVNEVFKNKINNMDKEYVKKIRRTVNEAGCWEGLIKVGKGDDEVYSSKMQVIYNEENHKNYVISLRDITERYNLKKKLKGNEKKLHSLTENIKDLIISTDKDNIIDYVNKSMMKLLCHKEEELIGQNINKFILSEPSVLKSLEDGSELIVEHYLRDKDKQIIKLETIRTPIYDETNEIQGWVLVARDIEYRDELEKLKIKYKEIQEYQEIKNEFFANLSHELRTPTNIIYSSIQLLDSQIDNNELFMDYYRKYDKTIKQNCFRMLRLINNLIDITKFEAGFLKTEMVNVNIVALIEDITLSIIPYVESKEINIVFDTEYEELEIMCDIEKIERVILNLLANAIKFTNLGGNILVHIRLNGEYVEILVKDDGIGIPQHMKDVIFERFVQVSKSFNRLKEGSGIGLALVKSLIDLHNGNVFLNDTEDKGCEFIIKLPNKKLRYAEEFVVSKEEKPLQEKISIELSDIYDIL
ncbi:PAS domain-containing sensor histidine kinase [Clostridium sp.]|uniref:sensor histidine kinase n=1 Tax=Clostridium sp. TaxID=1506 RepID=UPI003F352075